VQRVRAPGNHVAHDLGVDGLGFETLDTQIDGVTPGGGPSSVPDVNRRWWMAAAAVLGLVVVASATTAGTVPLWHEAQPVARQAPAAERTEEPVDSVAPTRLSNSADGREWELDWLARVFAWTLVAGLVALVVWWLARVRWRRPSPRKIESGQAAALPAVTETVGDAESELQEVLLGGSPRNAIVRCWVRLEQAVAAAGVARTPSETSLEFTTRVLAAMTVDDASIRRLGALYREARFSRHALGEAHRRAAIESLTELLEQLNARAVDRELVQ
jgi:hypothetical protein